LCVRLDDVLGSILRNRFDRNLIKLQKGQILNSLLFYFT
jgi:hypothetical protein